MLTELSPMEPLPWSKCCCCDIGQQQHPPPSLPLAAPPPPTLLLLSCLHSVCKPCLSRHVADEPATGDERRGKRAAAATLLSLRCPSCDDLVDVCLTVLPTSASCAAVAEATPTQQQSTSHTVGNRAWCGACADTQRAADHWCAHCNDHLCDSCLPLHRRFAFAHTVVPLSLLRPSSGADATCSGFALPPVVACPAHGAADAAPAALLFCPSCCRAACRPCAGRCVEAGHLLFDLGDEHARRTAIASAADALRSAARSAGTALAALRCCKLDGRRKRNGGGDGCDDSVDDRRLQRGALTDGRQRALAGLEVARARARRSLVAFYDSAAHRQSEAAARGGDAKCGPLCAAADRALRCARLLLRDEAPDVGTLLQQKGLLFERMRRLSGDIERCLAMSTIQPVTVTRGAYGGRGGGAAPVGALVPNTERLQLARNLRSNIASCIGRPVMRSLGAHHHQASAASNRATPAASVKALLLAAVHACRVTLPGSCADMSVTSDGTILLAAYKEGMLEYNMQGKKLGTWKPPPSSDLGDTVISLESLDDGRVAAGVLWSHAVAIVGRRAPKSQVRGDSASGEWHLLQRIALRALPRHVCSYGHLLGVAGTRNSRQGYEVDVMRLRDGRAIISKTLDYVVQVMGVTARAVILAVDKKWASGGGNGKAVLAFSHTWHQLWEIATSESVMEIWPQPCCHVLAVGLGITTELLLIDAADGKCMGSLLAVHSPPGRPESTEGVCVAYNARRAELLAMPWDGCTVSVHRVTGMF